MIALELDNPNAAFAPGEALKGTIRWQLEKMPKRIELRLFWFTSGRGTRDVGAVDVRQLACAQAAGPVRFEFALPTGPLSFTGQLITLQWAIEAVIHPGSETQRIEFVLSPSGAPISLPAETAAV
jgi:hypothetical protein